MRVAMPFSALGRRSRGGARESTGFRRLFSFFSCSKISFYTMEFHSFVHTFLFWAPLLHGADLPNLANGGGARGYHRGAEKNRARTDRLVCAMRAYQHAYYAHITAHLSHFRISGHTGLSASTCLRIER